jgi:autotransporter translocation and assembly factor TamB
MLQRRVTPAHRYVRRTLQVIALVGTILVGIVALALIATQTPWFRDWLRRFAVREADQYLNGQLSIGSLGGNLFTGFELGDVALEMNGERIVTLKRLEVKYRIGDLLSSGRTVQSIRLEQPFVLLRRTAQGWNVASLPKVQAQEANRQGPAHPLSLPDIEIVDGSAVVDDRVPSPSYTIPKRIDRLDAKAGFEYAPVHYSLTLERFSFAGHSPDVTVTSLSGRTGTRGDDLHLENVAIRTAASSVTVDGAVRNYLSRPDLNLTVTAPKVSIPEFAGVLPGAQGYNLHPSFNVKAEGPEDNLRVTLSAQSEAGAIDGAITADALAPGYRATGDLDVHDLNLAPLLKAPAQKSDITARVQLDLAMRTAAEGQPSAAPALERIHGTFKYDAPSVQAAGYTARNVKGTGSLEGRKIGFDARANAYGGSVAAKGSLVTPAATGAPLQFDVAGSAAHVDLRSLPARLNLPRMTTSLNASAYHVTGETSVRRSTVTGSATLGRSVIEGATITDGTVATFAYAAAGRGTPDVSYTARGGVRDADLYTIGRGFRIAALVKPEYASRLNADFDVRAKGTALPEMTLDTTATVSNSAIMGGTIPRMAVEAHLAGGGLNGKVNGDLRGFDPARVTGNDTYKGRVNGSVDASFGVKDLSAPMTPDAIAADGRVTLGESQIGPLRVNSADIEGQYADARGNLRQAVIKGPDVDVQAAGTIALDRSSASNLKYHVTSTNLSELAKLGNVQGVSGSASVDGTLTGNASSLETTGTFDGSDIAYQSNKALDLNSTFDVTIPDLQFARAEVKANTTGTFIQAGGLQINELHAGTTYADQKLDFQVHVTQAPPTAEDAAAAGGNPAAARQLDAGGTVLFHTDHQEVHLPSLSLKTQGVEWHSAPGAEATIQYGKNRLELQNVRLVNGNQSLGIDGTFSLGDNPEPGTISVTAQHVDLSQIDKLAMLNRGITGTLDASARITGTSKLPAVDGRVDIANGGVAQFKYQALSATAKYGDNRVVLDAKLTQSPGVELDAAGTIPLTALRRNPPWVTGHIEASPGDQLDVRVKSSRINLAIVQSFTTAVTDVTGTVEADVHVTGSGEDPHFTGFAALEDGGFSVPDAGTKFSGLTTRIELRSDRVLVPQFHVLDQHGDTLAIGGELAMHEGQGGAVNVAIDSDNFKLMDNELGDVHVETHLKVSGAVRRPRIEGDVRMDQARLELDRLLLQFASPYSEEALPDVVTSEDTRPQTGKGAEQAADAALAKGREINQQQRGAQNATAPTGIGATGALAPVAVNVHFVVPDNMVVRGQDIRPGGPTAMQVGNVNATIGADLQITKQADAPITLRGTANTVRGFYEFQGRRFDLVRDGSARFLGLPEINPALDVSATRTIPNSGVVAKIHVTGTMRAPELALSSEPPLDESDILSLIIFNRNVNELGTGERASLAETAGSIASGFIASPLSRSVGRALDVDLFEITTTDPETGETAGGVTLGKQVGDKAFVRYRQQFGQRSFTQFQIEYDLTRFMRFEGSVAPETTSAVNRLTQRRVQKMTADLIFFFNY